jgi:hypothetical protein
MFYVKNSAGEYASEGFDSFEAATTDRDYCARVNPGETFTVVFERPE